MISAASYNVVFALGHFTNLSLLPVGTHSVIVLVVLSIHMTFLEKY
jgi:hypothetical protein